MSPPQRLKACIAEINASLDGVLGWLSCREIEFLATLGACPTAHGEMLELGSLNGKSAIVLAKAAQLADQARLTTVDTVARDMLHQNLRRAGVDEFVDVMTMRSADLIPNWNRPLRLLWHDGANDFETVVNDIDGFLPHLTDGGIVAFDDVLNTSGDRIGAYLHRVLESEKLGPAGVCGAIGWAQYRCDAADAAPHQSDKIKLIRQLQRLMPFHALPESQRGRFLARLRYKVLRAFVPHRDFEPQDWLRRVA